MDGDKQRPIGPIKSKCVKESTWYDIGEGGLVCDNLLSWNLMTFSFIVRLLFPSAVDSDVDVYVEEDILKKSIELFK